MWYCFIKTNLFYSYFMDLVMICTTEILVTPHHTFTRQKQDQLLFFYSNVLYRGAS
jgi:hypothetical protein